MTSQRTRSSSTSARAAGSSLRESGTGSAGTGSGGSASEPMVNLTGAAAFTELFYLVVVERLPSGVSVLHMWRIVLSSQGMRAARARTQHRII